MNLERTTLPAALLLAALVAGCGRGGRADIPYSTLVREVEAGNVQHVEIDGDQTTVTFVNPPPASAKGKQELRVLLPPSEDERVKFLRLLQEHEIAFVVSD